MNHVSSSHFDPRTFLATEGPGRSILRHKASQAFFCQGGPADAVFYLQNGRAKLTVVSKRGKEATVTLLASGTSLAKSRWRERERFARPRRRPFPPAWCSGSRETGCSASCMRNMRSPTFSCSSF